MRLESKRCLTLVKRRKHYSKSVSTSFNAIFEYMNRQASYDSHINSQPNSSSSGYGSTGCQSGGSYDDVRRSHHRQNPQPDKNLQSQKKQNSNAWNQTYEGEADNLNAQISRLSLVAWGYEDAEKPKLTARRAVGGVHDHVRLLRPVVVDGMSLSVVFNNHRSFLFDGSLNRAISNNPDYCEILSTKAFLLILHYYLGRGHLIRILVPNFYLHNYQKHKLVDDENTFHHLLFQGLVSGSSSFEHVLKEVCDSEACLVMDLAEYNRFYDELPKRVKDIIGILKRSENQKSKSFTDLTSRFVQPYFLGPEKRLIIPSDNSIHLEYKWMEDQMTENSVINGTIYKKLYKYQLTFEEQVKWLKLCDRFLGSDRMLTETKRVDLVMEEDGRRQR
ncbi:hypothetical protein L596_030923 [Steinernema carpocapsae]|uniref:Uncharacterized protein n=1 Tax=Steinernema carpocapsae TaxID=34508 RepID=A0A4V5ZZV1_STECR|nr:hypothetical protein L596_030923 [Steinernema carpocapsae]